MITTFFSTTYFQTFLKITISGQAPGKKPPAQSPLDVTPPLPVPLPDAVGAIRKMKGIIKSISVIAHDIVVIRLLCHF